MQKVVATHERKSQPPLAENIIVVKRAGNQISEGAKAPEKGCYEYPNPHDTQAEI